MGGKGFKRKLVHSVALAIMVNFCGDMHILQTQTHFYYVFLHNYHLHVMLSCYGDVC